MQNFATAWERATAEKYSDACCSELQAVGHVQLQKPPGDFISCTEPTRNSNDWILFCDREAEDEAEEEESCQGNGEEEEEGPEPCGDCYGAPFDPLAALDSSREEAPCDGSLQFAPGPTTAPPRFHRCFKFALDSGAPVAATPPIAGSAAAKPPPSGYSLSAGLWTEGSSSDPDDVGGGAVHAAADADAAAHPDADAHSDDLLGQRPLLEQCAVGLAGYSCWS